MPLPQPQHSLASAFGRAGVPLFRQVALWGMIFSSASVAAQDVSEAVFAEIDSSHNWNEVFFDEGTGTRENGGWRDGIWQRKWFLDGEIAAVENTPDGMHLQAGPRYRENAHHMVLWTHDTFEGDLKIEYEFTRTDRQDRCVVLLYIQATGSGMGPYAEDITAWNELRSVPTMGHYFRHMNAYAISYAVHNPFAGNGYTDYIRARRYQPELASLRGTELGAYTETGLWKPFVSYQVTVVKEDRRLAMRVEGDGQVAYFHFENPDYPVITHGRVGLRHMFTRSALYRNFRISETGQGN